MRTIDINYSVIDDIRKTLSNINSVALKIYIRFYIDNVLYKTIVIKYFCGYFYYKVSFGTNLECLVLNNLHFDYFDYIGNSLRLGKIECHGHGEFFGTDKLIIKFNRGV